MKNELALADFGPLAAKLQADLLAANDDITALDAALGDGDLGVTCRLGLQAVVDLGEAPGEGLGDAVLKAGMAFNQAGASTYGALVATGAMRAAKYAKDNGLTAWDLGALAGGLAAAAEGIMQRGKAAAGDKTLLDALLPAVAALQAALAAGQSLGEALAGAAQAAADGAAATAPWQSKFGRASWLQERTIGTPDAGATVVAIVLKSLAEYVQTGD
jgi:dihydroxyacetone kinase-like protein